ncbi:MAG: phosphoenolpyruvate carboxylase [Hyphomicrobiaceae bacterium]|nr:phosphoenolpyruvate carboxylase [Hyphomicrobiaceae bacterium]
MTAPVDQQQQDTSWLDNWRKNLRTHRARVQNDPQFLPVKQLAFEMSRDMEKGTVSQDDLRQVTHRLCNEALLYRAGKMRQRLGETDEGKVLERFAKLVKASTQNEGAPVAFEDFRAMWEHPLNGAVFTAHPTFMMSRELRGVLVDLIGQKSELSEQNVASRLKNLRHGPDKQISLQNEHEEVQEALANAQQASQQMIGVILEVARQTYSEEWKAINPNPVELNSWVGYDMDGRNDISWYDSLRFRLLEKKIQVERDLAMIGAVRRTLGSDRADEKLQELVRLFTQEDVLLARHIELFAADLEDPKYLSIAANYLTENRDKGLAGDLTKALLLLDEAVGLVLDDEQCLQLVQLRASIKAQGLGTARMHFRVNAAQLHNVARVPLKITGNVDLASRVMLTKLDELIKSTKPQKINFASLALERATAIRQFLVITQILKHIDRTSPIRLLIAECENPFTVLAAVYLAKRYGVEELVDVSPLLETEEALDHGARILSLLLKTGSYRSYIQRRGRLCVQTGFSDAGRFIGQIPAALAIERFHGQLAEVVAKEAPQNDNGQTIDVLIFDTHGESMGRGTHPSSLNDRFEYVMTPWVRWKYRSKDIPLHHEVSFQGGDGYVLFGSKPLALTTLVSMLVSSCESAREEPDDLFYDDLDFSLDIFENIKEYQTSLFQNEDYHDALGAFGTGLLVKTGSRKSIRQFEAGHDNRTLIGEMRAIPHNAILQQMGYVLNIISGVGETVRFEQDRFVDMHKGSPRLRQIMSLVQHARAMSSIKTLASYSTLFDDAFWVTRPLNKDEAHLKNACIYLADLLRGDHRHDGIMHLATYLREDAVRLQELFDQLDIKVSLVKEPWREGHDIMHALRIALIQHIYLLAAQIPQFSMANDISRERVIGLILSMHVKEAVALLREVYPVSMPHAQDYDMSEEAGGLDHQGVSYADIQDDLIDPMEEAYELVLLLGTGIAHNFGAFG